MPSKPLAGKRVVVTRPRAQAASFGKALAQAGAVPIYFPTIDIVPIEPNPQLDQAIDAIETLDWVVFTSVNGVSIFFDRLRSRAVGRSVSGQAPVPAPAPPVERRHGKTRKKTTLKLFRVFPWIPWLNNSRPDPIALVKVAAIGPATAAKLRTHGVEPTLIPDEFIAEAIVESLGDVAGKRLLLPRAAAAREALAVELERRSAIVLEIAVYDTKPAALDHTALDEMRKGVDAVTFTSSSTVNHFVELLQDETPTIVNAATVACIGPITAATARELGLHVDVIAEQYTTEGLLQALKECLGNVAAAEPPRS